MADLTDVERNNLAAVADVLPSWNRHDIPSVLSFYHDDIVWDNMALGETYRGKEEVGAFLSRLFAAFPDLTFGVTENIARDRYVAEKWVMRGTHLGTFLGVPATGRPIEILGMSMVELESGTFLRDSFYFDAAGVMRQMGLLPPMEIGETPMGRAALWLMVNRMKVGIAIAVAAIVLIGIARLTDPDRPQG